MGMLAAMGDACSCSNDDEKPVINVEVTNRDWADAVKNDNDAAIRMQHHNDPDLVNYPVDERNGMAIHYVIRNSTPEKQPQHLKLLRQDLFQL